MIRLPKAWPLIALVLVAQAGVPALAHEGHDHGDAAVGRAAVAGPQRLSDGSAFVPKATQRLLKLRTAPAEEKTVRLALELTGHVIADPSASAKVQAAQPGRIAVGPRGFPALGQKVGRGEILAWLTPVSASLETGAQRAALAEVEAQLRIAEARSQRLAELEGSVPRKEIEAAALEAEGLAARRRALAGSLGAREALVAPVSGVVSRVAVAVGQVVEARETIMEIVDPRRLLIEALVYDPSLAADIASASASVPGNPRIALSLVGAGPELREHAVPVQFRVAAATPGLAVAQPVRIFAATRRAVRGLVVPRTAVVQESGAAMVWVHVSAERFSPVRVGVAPVDGDTVALSGAIEPGARVVVEGAALLSQIR